MLKCTGKRRTRRKQERFMISAVANLGTYTAYSKLHAVYSMSRCSILRDLQYSNTPATFRYDLLTVSHMDAIVVQFDSGVVVTKKATESSRPSEFPSGKGQGTLPCDEVTGEGVGPSARRRTEAARALRPLRSCIPETWWMQLLTALVPRGTRRCV
jgi:hypothetical protein